MNQLIGQAQGMSQAQSQLGSIQNCASQWGHTCTCTIKTVHIHADVAVDKVENGFLITIKGKRFVASKSSEIPALIDAEAA